MGIKNLSITIKLEYKPIYDPFHFPIFNFRKWKNTNLDFLLN